MREFPVLLLVVVACSGDGDTTRCRADTETARRETETARRETETARRELAAAKLEAGQLREELSRRAPQQKREQHDIAETRDLKENGRAAWTVAPGRYRVRVTTSGKGVRVRWVGASCPSSGEAAVYDSMCDVTATAQLVVENPGGITSSGPTETVHVSAVAP